MGLGRELECVHWGRGGFFLGGGGLLGESEKRAHHGSARRARPNQ